MKTLPLFKSNIMNKEILEIGSDVFCYVLAEYIENGLFESCAILRDCLMLFEIEYKIKTNRQNVMQWKNRLTPKREEELEQKAHKARKIIFKHINSIL